MCRLDSGDQGPVFNALLRHFHLSNANVNQALKRSAGTSSYQQINRFILGNIRNHFGAGELGLIFNEIFAGVMGNDGVELSVPHHIEQPACDEMESFREREKYPVLQRELMDKRWRIWCLANSSLLSSLFTRGYRQKFWRTLLEAGSEINVLTEPEATEQWHFVSFRNRVLDLIRNIDSRDGNLPPAFNLYPLHSDHRIALCKKPATDEYDSIATAYKGQEWRTKLGGNYNFLRIHPSLILPSALTERLRRGSSDDVSRLMFRELAADGTCVPTGASRMFMRVEGAEIDHENEVAPHASLFESESRSSQHAHTAYPSRLISAIEELDAVIDERASRQEERL